VTLPGLYFKEYAAPDDCEITDRAAWRTANPAIKAGFLRESALETDVGITPEGHFRIFRLGQWYEGVDSWLGSEGRKVWDALTSPWGFIEGAPTWVGVDVGLKRDSTAVVAVQKREDGRFHAVCKLWIPRADEPVDTTDVMRYLRELDDRYKLRAVSFDPRFFDVPAKYLEDEGLPMSEVPQSLERMTPAIGNLYEAIQKGEITHDGEEPFAQQVMNAVPRFNERGFTLAKGKSRGRIDACIALSLAMAEANNQKAVPEPLVAWG
jgi:phage terminase large subunit-like protein